MLRALPENHIHKNHYVNYLRFCVLLDKKTPLFYVKIQSFYSKSLTITNNKELNNNKNVGNYFNN